MTTVEAVFIYIRADNVLIVLTRNARCIRQNYKKRIVMVLVCVCVCVCVLILSDMAGKQL